MNVFVYGTLQPGGRFHDDYCAGREFLATKGWVYGRLFDFPQKGFPAALEDPTGKIYGHVLSFTDHTLELLEELDRLEGYDPQGAQEDNLYYRKMVSVHPIEAQNLPARGTPWSAWCYFMRSQRMRGYGGVEVATGRWHISSD